MRKVGYVAVDHGPRLALQALAARLQGEWLNPEAGAHVQLLVCGTSDSARGRALEASACAAANELRIPVVVVEDFPGNFRPVPSSGPRLLCVDSEFAAQLARQKVPGLAVHVGPAIRYDTLRQRLRELRAADDRHAGSAVLWIGQPETRDALRTLDVLMPALQSTLWFRAHPRDEGYGSGAYARILDRSRNRVEDMTAQPLDDCLRQRPRLVVTQFSSGAVEAGFWGIPSLNVLLPDAGGGRLRENKGYAVPPWCDAGASFLVTRGEEVAATVALAIGSPAAREHVQERFDDYFQVHAEATPGLINLLYNQGLL